MKRLDMQQVSAKVVSLTVFVFNAVAKYWAPSSLMLLFSRPSVVSVCIERRDWICRKWVQNLSLLPCLFAMQLPNAVLVHH
jgi:hypothetical protein